MDRTAIKWLGFCGAAKLPRSSKTQHYFTRSMVWTFCSKITNVMYILCAGLLGSETQKKGLHWGEWFCPLRCGGLFEIHCHEFLCVSLASENSECTSHGVRCCLADTTTFFSMDPVILPIAAGRFENRSFTSMCGVRLSPEHSESTYMAS